MVGQRKIFWSSEVRNAFCVCVIVPLISLKTKSIVG